MKSEEACTLGIQSVPRANEAFSSLLPYEPLYCAGIPIEIYRPAQQLGLRFFPVIDLSPSRIHEASNNLEQLRQWARQEPQWALPTGSVNGVLVLTATGEAGLDVLLAYCGDDWDWLDTLRSTNGTNRHIFFAWPEGRKQIRSIIGEGLRVLGEGDWVLVPPSQDPSGIVHVYQQPRLILMYPPAWLRKLVFETENPIHSDSLLGGIRGLYSGV